MNDRLVLLALAVLSVLVRSIRTVTSSVASLVCRDASLVETGELGGSARGFRIWKDTKRIGKLRTHAHCTLTSHNMKFKSFIGDRQVSDFARLDGGQQDIGH